MSAKAFAPIINTCMTTFTYEHTGPIGILGKAARYVFTEVMPDPFWPYDPDHAQAMLFVLHLHGHLGVRLSMVERSGKTLYRLTGVQGEHCVLEEAAGLVVELQPTSDGGTATVLEGRDAQLVWLIMMVDLPLDFVRNRTYFPDQIGVNWRSRHVGGETETWADWFVVAEAAA